MPRSGLGLIYLRMIVRRRQRPENDVCFCTTTMRILDSAAQTQKPRTHTCTIPDSLKPVQGQPLCTLLQQLQ